MKTFSLLSLLISFAAARGANHAIEGHFSGGGGPSSGGAYTLVGELSDPLGGTSNGGAYTLTTTLLGTAAVVATPGLPTLTLQALGEALILSWEAKPGSYVLETTPSLINPVWTPVPDGGVPPVKVAVTSNSAFFRLRKSP